jgi:hypothetical protein
MSSDSARFFCSQEMLTSAIQGTVAGTTCRSPVAAAALAAAALVP